MRFFSYFRKQKTPPAPALSEQPEKRAIDFQKLPTLLSIDQVSEILGVHPNTLRNWDKTGRLRAVRIGVRKDRRYERESIRSVYETLHRIREHPSEVPVPGPVASDTSQYIIQPGFSLNNVRLFMVSRKFSVFIYSAAMVAFSFVAIQVSFFAYIYLAQAQESAVETFRLEPVELSGWQGAPQATHIDLLPTSTVEQFTKENSAYFENADAKLEESAPAEDMTARVNPALQVKNFALPEDFPAESTLVGARLIVSLATAGVSRNEDVLKLSYSLDGGSTWKVANSLSVAEGTSNATGNQFLTYPLTAIAAIADISALQVQVEYHAAESGVESIAYVDGIALEADTQKPDPVIQEIGENVSFDQAQADLQPGDQPVVEVNVQEDSAFAFIGANSTTRDVKSVQITTPTGEVKQADIAVDEVQDGRVTTAQYQLQQDNFVEPGQYTVTMEVEQDGRRKTITYDFTWGALALNPDQAVYRLGQVATFSIGALDDQGHIVCDADIELTIGDPAGTRTTLTTKDKTVQVTDFCGIKDYYQEPDYQAQYTPTLVGTYTLDLVATVQGKSHRYTDTMQVQESPTFTLKRDGPTRVFPNINQPMRLAFTAFDTFSGTVRELVPGDFTVFPENGGTIQPYDTGTTIIRSIVWDVSLQAGTSATLGYSFKSPEKSPTIYPLGPAMVADWTEPRTWQLVIDPAYMYLLGNSATAPSGWTTSTTYDGYYPRGAASTVVTPPSGGAATHTHTVSNQTISAPSTEVTITGWGCIDVCANSATTAHTHGINTLTVGSANNDPLNHTFYLWKSNAQDPTTIPINAFVLFDAAPTGSWTRFTAADNRLVKISNSNTTGGTSDTHTHSLTWGSLTAASGLINLQADGITYTAASSTHTHTAPTGTTSTSYTSMPSYIQSLIYQATANNSVPQNLITMWDAAPPSGWTTVSGASQTYNGQFIRGSATYSATPQSADTHSMANQTSGATGSASANGATTDVGTGAARNTHTHTITASFNASTDHKPQYFDVILAKCTNAGGCGAATTYSVAGNVYSDEGSTLITGTPTIRLLVNGTNTACAGGACTATVTSGAYTISNITTVSGDVLTLYLDTAGTALATTVTVGSGANLTGINLYQNRLIVRHETGASITNTQILTGYGTYADTDILYYTAASPALTIGNLTYSNIELHIWTGMTYDPNGTVTTQGTGDLHVDDSASAYLDTVSNVIAQNVSIDASATLYVQNTTTVNGAANAGITAAGTLNVSAGTLTVGNSTDEDLTINAGTLTVSGGTLTVTDQIKTTSGGTAETVNITGGTTNAQGTGTTTNSPIYFPEGTITVGGGGGAAIVNDSGVWYQTGGSLTVTTNADINVTGEFQMPSGTPTLNLNAGSLDSSTHWRLNAGTINLNGGSHHTGNDGIVEITNGGNAVTFNMTGGDLYVRGLLVYNSGVLTTNTVTGGNIHLGIVVNAGINYYLVNTSATFQIYNLLIDQTGFINASTTQTVKVKGSVTIANTMTFTTNSKTMQVDGGWVNNGTYTGGTSAITLRGGNISGTNDTSFSTLNIGDATTTATVTVNGTDDPTVTGTMLVDSGDTLSIGASRFVTHTGGTYTLNGTVSGAGTMVFTSTSPGPGATGSLISTTRYDATNGDVASTTVDVRTDYRQLEFYSNSTTARSVTLAAGTYQTNVSTGNLYVIADGASPGNLTLNGATNNPTMNIAYSLDFTGTGTSSEVITSGTGTWTVSENVNFTDGTYTATAGNTLDMNGVGTFTSNAQTMQNLSLTGSITLANATHTVVGNLNLAGGYTGITAGTSTITMTGTSNTIVGENETLNNLTIDPSSAGTITLQTSSLTASGTLTVAAGDTLSIASGITMSATGAAEVAGTGTISGAGTVRFTSASGGPGTTIASYIAIVRYDASAGNIAAATIDARTYDGRVEFYSSSATARTATLNIGTYAAASLYVIADGSSPGDLTLVGATNNPTVTIAGILDFTGTGASSEVITSGTGTWTVSGNVDFTGGTYTAATNNTLVMDGVSVNIYGNGQSLYNFSISPSTIGVVAMQTSNLTVTGTFTLSNTCQLTINAGLSFTLASTGTLTRGAGCAIAGTGTFIYQPATYSQTSGVSSGVRFDSTNNAQTINGSVTFGGAVEFYNSSASVGRNIALGNVGGRTFTFNSTVTITATAAGALTVDANTQDPNLTFTGAVSIGGAANGTVTLSANSANTLAFNGGMTVNATGVLTTNSSTVMTMAGDYTNNGTFNAGTGTVTLNGSGTQTLSGTMTGGSAFNNLIVTNASASNPDIIFGGSASTAATFTAATASTEIRFNAGSTYTFQNIVFNGQATGTRVALTSSSTGTQWNLNVAGTRAVSNTSVQDSNACGQAPNIPANDGTNLGLGNNSCWTFQGIIVSGTANGNVGATVRYAVNGTLRSETGTIGATTWTIEGVTAPAQFDKVVVWIDNVGTANESSGVTAYDGTGDITGMALDTNVLTLGSDDNQGIVQGDLEVVYDNFFDEDIMFRCPIVASCTLAVDDDDVYTSEKLVIRSGTQLVMGPSDSITTHDIQIDGTLTAGGTSNITVSGSWDNNDDFNSSGGETIIFTSTTTETIDSTGAVDMDVYDVRFTGVGGQWTLNSTWVVNNDVALNAGTFRVNNVLYVNGGDITGDGTLTYTAGTPTIFIGSTSGNFGGANPWTVYNLTLAHSAACNLPVTTAVGAGSITIGNVLTLAADGSCPIPDTDGASHNLNGGAKTWILQGSGTPFAKGGELVGATSTFRYTGTGATAIARNNVNITDYYGSLELSPASGTPTYTLTNGESYVINQNLTIATGVTLTSTGSTVYMNGTGALDAGGKTVNNLIINPAAAQTVTVQTNDVTVAGTLNVAVNGVMSIPNGRTVNWTGATFTLTGAISGQGTLRIDSSGVVPATGTLSSAVRLDATNGNTAIMYARTYGGEVHIYNSSVTSRIITMEAGTHTITGASSALNLRAENSGNMTLVGATNNPTVSVSGNLIYTGVGGGSEIITSGTGTWTVSGNVTFTGGTYTATAGNTLVMNGASVTLTSAAQTLQNLTLSGFITLANATHTVNGNLDMAGGTITAGSSTVTMTGTSNTIVGGNNSIQNLTIDPSSAGTITVQTSDLTVGGLLTVAAGDTLSIASGIILSNTYVLDVTGTGTISGAGTLRFTNVSGGPGTTITTLSSVVRFDATNGNIITTTLDVRTYAGRVEFYSGSSTARTATFAAGTYTISGASSHLYVIADGASPGDLTLAGATNNPTVNIGGSLDYTGVGTASEVITSGTGTWTVGGSVDFTGGTFTAAAGNTLIMNGTGTLTSDGQTLQNLTLSGTITLANATHTVNGNLNLTGGSTTAGSSTVTMTGTSNTITGGFKTLNNLNIDPSSAGTITLQTSDLTVGGTLTVASGDILSVNASRILSDTGAAEVAGTGTISGAGTLRFTDTSGGPGTTITTISLPTQYDATSGNIAGTTVDARTHTNQITFISTSTTARSITLGTGTFILSGASAHWYIAANGASPGDLSVTGASNNPTVTIGGDLDFVGVGSSSESLTTGSGTWTVSGNANFGGGTFTASTNNTFVMDGTSKTVTEGLGGLAFNNFRSSGSISFSAPLNDMLVSNDLTIDSGMSLTSGAGEGLIVGHNFTNNGGTFNANSGTVALYGSAGAINGTGSTTFNHLTIAGTTVTVTMSNADNTVGGTLTVDTGDTLSLASGRTMSATGAANLAGTGSITGAGTIRFTDTSGGPGTTITTLSAITRYDATNGNIASTTLDARTYGQLEFYMTGTTSRSATLAAGTYTLSGATAHLYMIDNGSNPGYLTLEGSVNNPTVTIGGNLDSTGSFPGHIIKTGTGAWTVSGNVDLTDASLQAATGNTFTMNGASASITASGQYMYDFLTAGSGTITLLDFLGVNNNVTIGGTSTFSGSGVSLGIEGSSLTGTGTLNFTGVGVISIRGDGGTLGGSNNDWTFNNLSFRIDSGCLVSCNVGCNRSTGSAGGSGAMIILGTIRTVYCNYGFAGESTAAHTFAAGSKTWILQGSGTGAGAPLYATYFDYDTSTFRFTGTGTTDIYATAYYNYELLPASGTPTYNFGGASVYGNAVIGTSVNFVGGTSQLYMLGDGKTIDAGGKTIYDFRVNGTNNTVTVINNNFTVTGPMQVATGSALSINAGRTVTYTGGSFIVGGTVSGAGTLTFTDTSSGPNTFGTISSVVRFDATNGDIDAVTLDVRTYGGRVEFYSSSSTARTAMFAAGTYILSGASSNLYVIADGASPGNVTLNGATNNPTVAIGGSLDYTGSGTSSEVITSGTGTWTVGGSVDFTGGTFTAAAGNTLIMNGTGTLTSAGNPLVHLTLSGTVTLANATHTVSGDLSLAGGTITPGTSTVTMTGTANAITGGGQTLGSVNVDPASAGTITLQTSDLTVAGTLTVASGDILSLSASRILSDLGAADIAGTGTISGAGTLRFTDTSGGPGTTATISTPVRFDASGGNIVAGTFDARTYSAAVEVYGNNASNSVTAPSGTFVFSSTLTTTQGGSGATTLDFNTNDPAVTVTGALSVGANTVFQASSAGAFNVNGNYTNSGTFTDSGGTVTLAGSSQQTLSGSMTGAGNNFNNLAITNASGTDPDTSPSVIFAAAADTAGTLTAVTPNTKLRFLAGATYALNTISFNGQAIGTRVYLRSSTNNSRWYLNSAGTRTVSFTNVRDSDACGQPPDIDAADGTNVDASGNRCWSINTLTFSITDTSVGYGTLDATAARWATGDLLGSPAAIGAHTLSIATGAAGGYVITYNGPAPSNGINTVDAATFTGDTNGTPGTEQFAISAATNGNATIPSAYQYGNGSSPNYSFVPSAATTIASEAGPTTTELITLYYMANISGLTLPGAYGTDIIYIVTATF